ncbi:uncharacterized protein LOC105160385 [Sesamum indicum]|uniref:Uncharacterized protein LOC105160385 n=1 Tax=Sesamum indicum TaxID=4182 RepID=A0A8M8UQ75_SESIN|nr:uncharacterized protein LOC105160385 [Sesamum indicum]
MEVDKRRASLETENKDFVDSGVVLNKEYEGCIRCLELQDKLTKANDKCGLLEIGMGEKNAVIEWLECKVGLMELKKLELEDELRVLKERNQELEKSNGNGEEEDKVTQLMIENNVLECEKRKAESEVEVWKVKCKKLELQVMELEKRLSAGMMKTGSGLPEMYQAKTIDLGGPSVVRAETENKANEDKDATGNLPVNTPSSMRYIGGDVFKGPPQNKLKSRVRKCLDFAADRRPHKNISPSTPGGRPPFVLLGISDSSDDLDTTDVHLPNVDNKGGKQICSSSSTNVGLGITLGEKELTSKDRCAAVVEHQIDEVETIGYIGRQPYIPTSKRRKVRRGVAYIVTSESENDNDDNIPICKLRSKHLSAHNSDNLQNRRSVDDSCSGDNRRELTPRRRLIRVGNLEHKGVSGKCSYKSTGSQKSIGIPEKMSDIVCEDDIEEDYSSSEGESLGGFLVSTSEVSKSDSFSNHEDLCENLDTPSGDWSCDSEHVSESSMEYDEVISGLRRGRKDKMKWEYEADMLADFGKRPELCMKAVCALYRQQTSEEKSCKSAILLNGRGFSQIHAFSGSALAEFLTDGDPHGDVKKSVEELKEFDVKGVEQCRKLATHYSKQLFEIYKNEEDPFFHP